MNVGAWRARLAHNTIHYLLASFTTTRRLKRTAGRGAAAPAVLLLTCHVGQAVLRRRLAAAEDVERARNALQAQHVVAVGGDVNLVDDLTVRVSDGQGVGGLEALHRAACRAAAGTSTSQTICSTLTVAGDRERGHSLHCALKDVDPVRGLPQSCST